MGFIPDDATTAGPVRASRNQLIGRMRLEKAQAGKSEADTADIDLAEQHTRQAFNWRRSEMDIRELHKEEEEQHEDCIDILVAILEHKGRYPEAKVIRGQSKRLVRRSTQLSALSTTSTITNADYGTPTDQPDMSRADRIAQAVERRDMKALGDLFPYHIEDVENASAEQRGFLLGSAVRRRDQHTARLILAEHSNLVNAIDPTRPRRRMTALHIAAKQGDVAMIDILLHHGADCNALDHSHETPLMKAVLAKQVDAVRSLLVPGTDTRSVDEDGWSLMHNAVSQEDIAVLSLLLDHGKDALSVEDLDGRTALHHAANNDSKLKQLRVMLDHGCELELINKPDNQGNTALDLVAAKLVNAQRDEIVRFLVNRGALLHRFPRRYHDYEALRHMKRSKPRSMSTSTMATVETSGTIGTVSSASGSALSSRSTRS